ncbi:unnamed protein product [Thlaspi arvense]|uniref:Secreted protein n=1 Tax=Thlaspi arvense TaxID=13288 RepID=A0AAU9T103_THLAR|nr:unnamed protein product [Thlaspi arvense]
MTFFLTRNSSITLASVLSLLVETHSESPLPRFSLHHQDHPPNLGLVWDLVVGREERHGLLEGTNANLWDAASVRQVLSGAEDTSHYLWVSLLLSLLHLRSNRFGRSLQGPANAFWLFLVKLAAALLE